MVDPIQRRGEWWQEQPDGSWLKWDEPAGQWRPQEFPPPPPENAEMGLAASASDSGLSTSAAPGNSLAPTPGYRYARGDDGTWWARSETTGELHWHDAAAGQWRRYVEPGRP